MYSIYVCWCRQRNECVCSPPTPVEQCSAVHGRPQWIKAYSNRTAATIVVVEQQHRPPSSRRPRRYCWYDDTNRHCRQGLCWSSEGLLTELQYSFKRRLDFEGPVKCAKPNHERSALFCSVLKSKVAIPSFFHGDYRLKNDAIILFVIKPTCNIQVLWVFQCLVCLSLTKDEQEHTPPRRWIEQKL